ncbi:hypothetical protein GN244_ATG15822 [Phytophthora infestans]|uniref:Secreted RxLR effector peptide protein n=1 Tax=Phytophthora infestans TaxID=4787 RepID=A0A833RSV8_PHYIN|nr:hypothetical protein GN244_ATG19634 [Phytophthora infestans]KAF4032322.1 hypothetical protein GN244_ATG15822 [Phytophthora infestans]KAF4140480.1 hypothetical protein GN958_ATG10340 [Phytophthora infestans]
MTLSTAVRALALLALLTLDVTFADPSPPQQLRSQHSVELPPARELQGKFGWAAWLAVLKTNIRYQPTGDKMLENLRKIKEKLQRSDE